MADLQNKSAVDMLTLIGTATKYAEKCDLDKEIEDLNRQKVAAQNDARDARMAAAKAKAEADLYCQQKKDEHEAHKRGVQENMAQAEQSHRQRLVKMEENARAALEATSNKLEDKNKELQAVIVQHTNWTAELGKVKSALEDAWKALTS